jgi:hypothetical protein
MAGRAAVEHARRKLQQRVCGRKRQHADEANARVHIRSLRANGKALSGWLTPYRCKFCGFWHVGHLR